jgi:hypothetical protein
VNTWTREEHRRCIVLRYQYTNFLLLLGVECPDIAVSVLKQIGLQQSRNGTIPPHPLPDAKSSLPEDLDILYPRLSVLDIQGCQHNSEISTIKTFLIYLDEFENIYFVKEKNEELMLVVHCLQVWSHAN